MIRTRLLHPAARAAGPTLAGVAGVAVLATVSPVAAAVLLGAMVICLGLTRPRLMIAVIIALFPFHPLAMRVALIDLGLTGDALLGLSAWKEMALAAALARVAWDALAGLRHRDDRAWRHLNLMDGLAVALAMIVLGFSVAQHTSAAVNAARLLLFPLGVYAAIRLDTGPGRRPDYLSLVVWTGAIVAAVGIFQTSFLGWEFVTRYWGTPELPIPWTFTSQNLIGPRAAATLSSPVEFATIGAALIPVAVATVLCRRDRAWPAAIALGVLVLGVGLSFARSAVLGSGLAVVVVVLAAQWAGLLQRRNVAVLALAIALPLMIGAAVYVNRGGLALLANTVETIASGESPPGQSPDGGSPAPPDDGPGGATPQDPSTVAHVTSLREGIQLVIANPLGVGLGNVGARVVPGSDVRPVYFAESWYLTMGLSLGWPGIVWAVAFTLGLVVTGWQAVRAGAHRAGLGLLGIAPAMVAIGLLLPTLMEPQVAIIPWTVAALAVVGSRPGRGEALAEAIPA